MNHTIRKKLKNKNKKLKLWRNKLDKKINKIKNTTTNKKS